MYAIVVMNRRLQYVESVIGPFEHALDAPNSDSASFLANHNWPDGARYDVVEMVSPAKAFQPAALTA